MNRKRRTIPTTPKRANSEHGTAAPLRLAILAAFALAVPVAVASTPVSAQIVPAASAVATGHFIYQTQLDLGNRASADDNLGESSALSSDGHTLLAGAPYRVVDGKHEAGAAEVFRFTSGAWSSPTQLDLGAAARGSDRTHDGDLLGWSVALNATGNVALVGALDRHVNGQVDGQGAVEVFRFANGRWSAPTELSLGSAAVGAGPNRDGDSFGKAVALSADGNTALIGAPGRAVNGRPRAGAAYIYRFSSGNWSRPVQLSLGSKATGGQQGRSGDVFGSSVALSDDGNTALVGAPGRYDDGNQGLGAGAEEAFRFTGGKWGAPVELTIPGTESLGNSVAMTGDGKTAFATAWLPASQTETAQLAQFDGAGWSTRQTLNLSDNPNAWTAAFSGDGSTILDSEWYHTLNGRTSAGGAQELHGGPAAWSPPSGISLPQPAQTDLFGGSLALSRNGALAVVGVLGRSVDGKQRAGAIAVFGYEPSAVAVTLNAAGTYGTSPALSGLSPTDTRIGYNPASGAGRVTGTLTCRTNATPSSPAGFYAHGQVWEPAYSIFSCAGLSDPGHTIVYDYVNSSYLVTLAPARLTYTGPVSITHAQDVTLSARLTSTTGAPIRGRILQMQIGRGSHAQACEAGPTDAQGNASCTIHAVSAFKSPNPARVWFSGDRPGPLHDYLPAYKRTPVTIVS